MKNANQVMEWLKNSLVEIPEPEKTKMKEWLIYLDDYTRKPLPVEELNDMTFDNINAWINAIPKLELLRNFLKKHTAYDIKQNINSSFRNKARNTKSKGKTNSLHLTDFAIDIQLDTANIIRSRIQNPTPSEAKELMAIGLYFIFYQKKEIIVENEKSVEVFKNKNFFHIQSKPFKDIKKRFIIEVS